MAGRSAQGYEEFSNLSILRGLGAFLQVFWKVKKEWLVLQIHDILILPHVVTRFSGGFFVIEVGRVGRRAKTYRKLSLLGIFSRLGSFPEVLGQTKRCPMLELYEILKLPHVVAFTIFFIFYCDRVRHAELLKLMKNDPF